LLCLPLISPPSDHEASFHFGFIHIMLFLRVSEMLEHWLNKCLNAQEGKGERERLTYSYKNHGADTSFSISGDISAKARGMERRAIYD
jgi:hypothetical protein